MNKSQLTQGFRDFKNLIENPKRCKKPSTGLNWKIPKVAIWQHNWNTQRKAGREKTAPSYWNYPRLATVERSHIPIDNYSRLRGILHWILKGLLFLKRAFRTNSPAYNQLNGRYKRILAQSIVTQKKVIDRPPNRQGFRLTVALKRRTGKVGSALQAVSNKWGIGKEFWILRPFHSSRTRTSLHIPPWLEEFKPLPATLLLRHRSLFHEPHMLQVIGVTLCYVKRYFNSHSMSTYFSWAHLDRWPNLVLDPTVSYIRAVSGHYYEKEDSCISPCITSTHITGLGWANCITG